MNKFFFLLGMSALTLVASCNRKAEAATPSTNSKGVAKSAPAYKLNSVSPQLSGDQAFETIKKNYSGKVILIDFWATWCPPCRAAIKQIHPIKAALKAKGVVFVYVTGETSPKADFDAFIPNVEGEHYRLTEKQWGEIGRRFNMAGIPAFMIINKDGSTAFSNASEGGYPGNEVIQNELEVALTK